MSSRLSPVPRSHSRASIAASVTTYHSFQDVDVHEPSTEVSSPTTLSPYIDPDPPTPPHFSKEDEHEPTSTQMMRRQDSGYESLTPRRQSQSQSRRRTSSTLSSSPPASRHRKRPSIRRCAKSGPAMTTNLARSTGSGTQAMYLTRSHQQPHHQHNSTFFHFPAPEPSTRASVDGIAALMTSTGVVGDLDYGYAYDDVAVEAPVHSAPPQTTHYWTSDRTRRLEYAAIDAASRGVRGWMMRHMVPDCFVPKDRRRITFNDDAGSVRRYRLELECEESAEKEGFSEGGKERKVWWSLWKSK